LQISNHLFKQSSNSSALDLLAPSSSHSTVTANIKTFDEQMTKAKLTKSRKKNLEELQMVQSTPAKAIKVFWQIA